MASVDHSLKVTVIHCKAWMIQVLTLAASFKEICCPANRLFLFRILHALVIDLWHIGYLLTLLTLFTEKLIQFWDSSLEGLKFSISILSPLSGLPSVSLIILFSLMVSFCSSSICFLAVASIVNSGIAFANYLKNSNLFGRRYVP